MTKTSTHESINDVIVSMKDKKILDTKKVTDKYHTFGDLYEQRAFLFSIICNQNKKIAWKSRKHFNEEVDPMFEGDFAVGLFTDKGPACFHFKLKYWNLFDVKEIDRAPEYDGYSPKEALERFMSIVNK